MLVKMTIKRVYDYGKALTIFVGFIPVYSAYYWIKEKATYTSSLRWCNKCGIYKTVMLPFDGKYKMCCEKCGRRSYGS